MSNLKDTLTPEELVELDKIEKEWLALTVTPKPEPMFGQALPQVLRRPQRFQNYDPWPDVPFVEERRSMTMLTVVMYGALWGIALALVFYFNWGPK